MATYLNDVKHSVDGGLSLAPAVRTTSVAQGLPAR